MQAAERDYDLEQEVALLAEAVEQAGRLAQARRRKGVRARNKGDGSPVTEADLAVDALLRERLTQARPHYGWLSEESRESPARPGAPTFVVDPIDGTYGYIKDRDTWTVVATLLDDGVPIAAAVANPRRDEIYTAARGSGAWLNGRPIRVSTRARLDGAHIAGGTSLRDNLGAPADLSFTRAASMAYRLCLVASGACDGTVALTPKSDWDIAAGQLLVQEAGGRASDAAGRAFELNRGRRHPHVVAANPALHAEILRRLAATSSRK